MLSHAFCLYYLKGKTIITFDLNNNPCTVRYTDFSLIVIMKPLIILLF